MAFNWKTFQTRTLTAIVFAAVMLTGLLWNQWSFLILFSIIHFGCWWEYLKLGEKIYNTSIDTIIKYFFFICGYFLMLAIGFSNYSYNFTTKLFGVAVNIEWFLAILILISLVGLFSQSQKLSGKIKKFTFFGLIYISIVWGLMICLRRYLFIAEINTNYAIPPDWHKIVVPCTIVFSIWICDTMAYIVGSLIGKTPLSKISPKKTWEGTIGGIVLATIVAATIAWRFDFDIQSMVAIAAISSTAGTFGDLLESKLKRMAAVKDSGNIMPGHGGFLDRFDSLLLATPAVWLYVYFLMR
jgi:phosphatidate cytidylyltransferase